MGKLLKGKFGLGGNRREDAVQSLVTALARKDNETAGHATRVVGFSMRLGKEIGLNVDQLIDLELGSILHDIGKIDVPDAILKKPGKLTQDEYAIMKMHPFFGWRTLQMPGLEFLAGAARVVAQHHEKFDGSGYPLGLAGEDIYICARVFAVADTFDAITSDRCYRPGKSYWEAAEELERFSGTQFDPYVVDAFFCVAQEDWDTIRLDSEIRRAA